MPSAHVDASSTCSTFRSRLRLIFQPVCALSWRMLQCSTHVLTKRRTLALLGTMFQPGHHQQFMQRGLASHERGILNVKQAEA